MDSFIKYMTKEVLNSNFKTEHLSIVFPNQRAGVYFKHYYKELSSSINFLPKIFTFESFVEYITNTKKTPKIELLFLLYESYKKITPPADTEPFDQFINWADTVLEDFNLIDLNIGATDQVFEQLKNINKIHNWEPNTDLSKNYLTFLQNLAPLYHEFVKLLKSKNKSYQGLLYRDAVDQITLFTEHTHEKFIFSGFNFFKKSEWFIVSELVNNNKATIYWNIPKRYNFLFDQYSKINTYKEEQWKNGIQFNKPDNSSTKIEIIGTNQNTSAIKYTSALIKEKSDHSKTAIVPVNQEMIPALLESMPPSIDVLNITMGLPIKSFGIYALIKHFFQLHLDYEDQNKGLYFKNINTILEHPLISMFDHEAKQWKNAIVGKQKIFLSSKDVYDLKAGIPSPFNDIFSDLYNKTINDYLEALNSFINQIKHKVSETEKEVLFHFYKIHNQLRQWIEQYNPGLSVKYFYNIYQQVVFNDQINILGEPLKGLQIMGLLETQTLMFDHIILLGTNEGLIPTDTKKNSYIPFDVRFQHGLPTHLDKQAQQAIIFAQILEQSKNVTIIYNTDQDTFGANEMSRFVQHLIWEKPEIAHYTLNSGIQLKKVLPIHIPKNKSLQQSIKQWMQQGISPSSLGTYTYDPIEFYKQYILNIKPKEEIQEAIEDNIMGTVVHNTLEELYTPFVGKILSVNDLKNAQKKIEETIDRHFNKCFGGAHLFQGINYLIVNIAKHFVKRFIKSEILAIENGHEIKILNLEKKYSAKYNSENIPFEITFKGIIDRIDVFDGTLRIIDYKTGKVEPAQLIVKDFEDKVTHYKYAKAIQVIIYAYLFLNNNELPKDQVVTAGIISFKNYLAGFIPLNFNHSKTPDRIINRQKVNELMQTIELLIVELFDVKQNIIEKIA